LGFWIKKKMPAAALCLLVPAPSSRGGEKGDDRCSGRRGRKRKEKKITLTPEHPTLPPAAPLSSEGEGGKWEGSCSFRGPVGGKEKGKRRETPCSLAAVVAERGDGENVNLRKGGSPSLFCPGGRGGRENFYSPLSEEKDPLLQKYQGIHR